MPAQQLDFSRGSCDGIPCEQGADFAYEMVWSLEEDGVETPVDLSEYTAKMQVKENTSADEEIVELTDGAGITLGSDGSIALHIGADETAEFTPGLYKYDLELTSDTGFVTRLIEGIFEVIGEITT